MNLDFVRTGPSHVHRSRVPPCVSWAFLVFVAGHLGTNMTQF